MSELECVMIMIDFSFFFFLLGLMLLLHIKCGFYIAVIISGNILPGDSSSLHLLQYQLEEGEAPEDLTPDLSLGQGHWRENQHVKAVGYLEEAHASTGESVQKTFPPAGFKPRTVLP